MHKSKLINAYVVVCGHRNSSHVATRNGHTGRRRMWHNILFLWTKSHSNTNKKKKKKLTSEWYTNIVQHANAVPYSKIFIIYLSITLKMLFHLYKLRDASVSLLKFNFRYWILLDCEFVSTTKFSNTSFKEFRGQSFIILGWL